MITKNKGSNDLTWEEFERVEICVGTIIEVDDFVKAHNPSYKLKIDFGKKGIKKSSAQITKLYTKEELKGRQIVAVINFPPKQIADFMSECLVLGAVGEDDSVILLKTDTMVDNGTRIG